VFGIKLKLCNRSFVCGIGLKPIRIFQQAGRNEKRWNLIVGASARVYKTQLRRGPGFPHRSFVGTTVLLIPSMLCFV